MIIEIHLIAQHICHVARLSIQPHSLHFLALIDYNKKEKKISPSFSLTETNFPCSKSNCLSVFKWHFSMHRLQISPNFSSLSLLTEALFPEELQLLMFAGDSTRFRSLFEFVPVLVLCLELVWDWFVSESELEPSCKRAAVNHVDRSLDRRICFSASERIFRACCNLSSSASVTEEAKNKERKLTQV